MTRSASATLVALVLLVAVGGCGGERSGHPAPDRVQAAVCPDEPPDAGGLEPDDGVGGELVPTAPAPVRLTLCTYGPAPHARSTPTVVTYSGDDVRTGVEELNGFPSFTDPDDHVCNAAMWPGYLLLISHADDTVTALSVDRSCGLVSNDSGAVRMGVPSIVAAT
jgi:hypothetical protein